MCIDRGKLGNRLKLLLEGKELYLVHLCYGTYKVFMNDQRNRILRDGICSCAKRRTNYDHYTVSTTFKGELNGCMMDNQRGTSEQLIESLLLWGCGDWYVTVSNEGENLKVRKI